jgi:hypothetical protein
MLTRILTVALAVGTLAAGTAYAQTGSTTSPSTSPSPSTTTPSTSGSGSMSGGSSMGGSSTQQAQGTFDVTKYKTKAECLTAARSAKADTTLCNAVK